MRILVLTPGAYGVNGGIGLYNRDIIEALAEHPALSEISVLPQEIQRAYSGLPSKARSVDGAARGRLSFIWAALKEMTARCDLMICGHIFLLPLAVPLARLKRVPLVLMVYGIDVWRVWKRLTPWLVRKVDAIWSISEITTARMQSWANLPLDRFRQLPNAIQLDRYGMDGDPGKIRQRHGLIGKRLLMTLARLPGFDRYKGVDEVLECLPQLRDKDPTIAYLIVGDGEDRARLEEKARTLGVADHVHFVGYVAEEEKADYYRAADLFVMPSRGEGFGFVFLEALACGVPCVGSCLDGSREALRDGLLGELPDPRDLADLIAAVERGFARPRGIPAGLAYFGWPEFCKRVSLSTNALLKAHANG